MQLGNTEPRAISQRPAAKDSPFFDSSLTLPVQADSETGIAIHELAHDLNNIMFIVQGYTQLMLARAGANSDDYNDLTKISDATDRAVARVQDLLAVSRRESNPTRTVELHEVLVQVVALSETSLSTRIEFSTDFSGSFGKVNANPDELKRVLLTALMNAQALGYEHGLRIRYRQGVPSHAPTDRDKKRSKAEAIVSIDVRDFTAAGPANRDVLWARAFTGIRESIRRMGGELAVERPPGVSPTVTMSFPLVEVSVEAKEDPINMTPVAQERARILFVDDDEAIVRLMQLMLTRLGHEVEAFNSSTEALARFRESPLDFDIVITDQTMPKLTGAELAREISDLRRDIPIVLSSGFGETVGEDDTGKPMIAEYIKKPILTRELAAVIDRVLKNSQQGGPSDG